MFDLKVAHLSVQRVGRAFLRAEGLTPARFDLMNALGSKGMRQSDLWKRLEVTRSVICEMVRSLAGLGWVKRVRAADSRTWIVMLTQAGRALFERAFARHVETGNVTVALDPGLGHGHVEADTLKARNDLWWICLGIVEAFRTREPWRGPDLYCCDPEDYYMWLTWPEDLDDLTPSAASE